MTHVKFIGGPYDGMDMEMSIEEGNGQYESVLKMPLLKYYRAALKAADVPPGGSATVEVQSQGVVTYVRDRRGLYIFDSEEVLEWS
jgi:hypothetical protein